VRWEVVEAGSELCPEVGFDVIRVKIDFRFIFLKKNDGILLIVGIKCYKSKNSRQQCSGSKACIICGTENTAYAVISFYRLFQLNT
jgi:hypothetical protein